MCKILYTRYCQLICVHEHYVQQWHDGTTKMSEITDKLTSTHSKLLKLPLVALFSFFFCFVLEDFPFHVDHVIRGILLVLKFEF